MLSRELFTLDKGHRYLEYSFSPDTSIEGSERAREELLHIWEMSCETPFLFSKEDDCLKMAELFIGALRKEIDRLKKEMSSS